MEAFSKNFCRTFISGISLLLDLAALIWYRHRSIHSSPTALVNFVKYVCRAKKGSYINKAVSSCVMVVWNDSIVEVGSRHQSEACGNSWTWNKMDEKFGFCIKFYARIQIFKSLGPTKLF